MTESETGTAPPVANDPPISITLPYSAWNVVADLVGRGAFTYVMHIMVALHVQSEAQIAAYEAQLAAQQNTGSPNPQKPVGSDPASSTMKVH